MKNFDQNGGWGGPSEGLSHQIVTTSNRSNTPFEAKGQFAGSSNDPACSHGPPENEIAAQAEPLDGDKSGKLDGVSESKRYHAHRAAATPSLAVSSSLLATLSKPIRNAEVFNAALTGTLLTRGPSRKATALSARSTRRFSRKWQQSPDRTASVHRRRRLGGSGGMPDTIRHHYTEGQRAALSVVAGEVKHHGACDLPIDRIAAIAGVSRTTVQNAIREARALGHLAVGMRPRPGLKNLTNVVRVISAEWMAWLKRGPSLARSIGFKTIHPTKNQASNSIKSRGNLGVESAAKGLGRKENGRSYQPAQRARYSDAS